VGVSDTDVEVIIIVQSATSHKVKNNSDGLARSHEPWTEEEEKRLLNLYHAGERVGDIAKQHRRTRGAIQSRLKKLGIDL
jgi:ATP-dependent DNA helicase RecQ